MIGQLITSQPFDLKLTLKCAQGHRWRKCDDEWYFSILCGDLVRINQEGGAGGPLRFESKASKSRIEARLRWQFRMKDDDEDVGKVYSYLRQDPQMARLVNLYMGLRIMRVDAWECLVFFILFMGTGISSVLKTIDRVCKVSGQTLTLNGCSQFRFPTPGELLRGDGESYGPTLVDRLKKASLLFPNGTLSVEALPRATYAELITELRKLNKRKQLPGVGPKTANCVTLFALNQMDAFPVDSHIRRALKGLYKGQGVPEVSNPNSLSWNQHQRLVKWAQKRFGRYAGYASQFLFADHYPETSRQHASAT